MTRRNTLQCVHEPFGDAYYFGPERIHERYEQDEKGRLESGYSDSTYKTIFDRIAKEHSEVGSFHCPNICLVFVTISFLSLFDVAVSNQVFLHTSSLPFVD